MHGTLPDRLIILDLLLPPLLLALACMQITCSDGGSCITFKPADSSPANTSTSGAGGSSTTKTTSSSAAAAAASAAAAAKVVIPNQAPVITLITANGFGSIVRVRQGASYDLCKDGVAPTADSPCEPGATAVDPDGAAGDSAGSASSTTTTAAASLNKTDEVVVCPPAQCLSKGCSPMELRRHYFSVKGLKGCGIDTSLPEGTQFKVIFSSMQREPVVPPLPSYIAVFSAHLPRVMYPYSCSSSTSFCVKVLLACSMLLESPMSIWLQHAEC